MVYCYMHGNTIFVRWVPIYSVYNHIALVVITLPGVIFKIFNTSSIISLLTSINLRFFFYIQCEKGYGSSNSIQGLRNGQQFAAFYEIFIFEMHPLNIGRVFSGAYWRPEPMDLEMVSLPG